MALNSEFLSIRNIENITSNILKQLKTKQEEDFGLKWVA